MIAPKLCVSVDRPAALHPRHPLFQAADALVIKDQRILRQVGVPDLRLTHLSEQDSRNIAAAVNSGKPLIYHAKQISDEVPLLEKNKIPYASYHLSPDPSSQETGPVHFLAQFEKMLGLLTRNYSGVVAFENMSYIPGSAIPRFVSETKLINELFASFPGLYFLLDLAHASVAAHWLGLDVHKYIASLPLSKAIEIHLSHSKAGVDAHEPPEEQEFQLLSYALVKGARPQYLTVEYAKDADILLDAYRHLRLFVEGIIL